MISISNQQSLDPKLQTHFHAHQPTDFDEWFDILTRRVWSPIVWKGGVRLKAKFEHSEYIVLDCDNGLTTIADAQDFCEGAGMAYIIGATKSHQKEKRSSTGKVTPACDRFRLLFRASEVMTKRELYEYNMGLFIDYFHADPQCKDAARYYFPCREIVAWGKGKRLDWKFDFDEDYEPQEIRNEKRRQRYATQYSKLHLPPWIEEIVTGARAIPVGERHKTAYSLGAAMSIIGFSVDECVGVLARTELRHIGDHELYRAVLNGWHREQGDRR